MESLAKLFLGKQMGCCVPGIISLRHPPEDKQYRRYGPGRQQWINFGHDPSRFVEIATPKDELQKGVSHPNPCNRVDGGSQKILSSLFQNDEQWMMRRRIHQPLEATQYLRLGLDRWKSFIASQELLEPFRPCHHWCHLRLCVEIGLHDRATSEEQSCTIDHDLKPGVGQLKICFRCLRVKFIRLGPASRATRAHVAPPGGGTWQLALEGPDADPERSTRRRGRRSAG
jgi:hypothetical protein